MSVLHGVQAIEKHQQREVGRNSDSLFLPQGVELVLQSPGEVTGGCEAGNIHGHEARHSLHVSVDTRCHEGLLSLLDELVGQLQSSAVRASGDLLDQGVGHVFGQPVLDLAREFNPALGVGALAERASNSNINKLLKSVLLQD